MLLLLSAHLQLPCHADSMAVHALTSAAGVWAAPARRWLESEVRAQHVASGIQQQLWDPQASSAKILEGASLTVDYVWSDDPTVPHIDGTEVILPDGARTGRTPEVALWRLTLFTIANVWAVVLLLSWPVGSLGSALQDWPWQASLFVSQAVTVMLVRPDPASCHTSCGTNCPPPTHLSLMRWALHLLISSSCLAAVAQVLWVTTPSLQPLFTWWLVQRRPNHWLWDKEPMATVYEVRPWEAGSSQPPACVTAGIPNPGLVSCLTHRASAFAQPQLPGLLPVYSVLAQ